MNNEHNIVDKFLNRVEKESNKKVIYKKVYVKPSKFKTVVGFIFSVLFFIAIIGLFSFNLLFFILLGFNIIILLYYGINLFTEKGFPLPKTIAYELPDEEEVVEEEEDEEPINQDEYDIEEQPEIDLEDEDEERQ